MTPFAMLVKREYRTGDWRDSTYERADGSQFRVAIPACHRSGQEGPYPRFYNEVAEAEMVLGLVEERTPQP